MVAPLHSLDSVAVLVVAEDPALRGSLVQLLASEAGARVTGGLSPSDLLRTVPADVYAWELGTDADHGARQLRTHGGTQTPALALVRTPAEARLAQAAGARGVMHRDALRESGGATRLVAALRACALGFVVSDMPPEPEPEPRPAVAVTARESQVLALLAEGHPNKIIADRLSISEHTAKFHVNALIHKLHAQSRTDAVARAIRAGLVAA